MGDGEEFWPNENLAAESSRRVRAILPIGKCTAHFEDGVIDPLSLDINCPISSAGRWRFRINPSQLAVSRVDVLESSANL